MNPSLFAGLLCVASVGNATAHRLDEYLQATRIAVAPTRIDFSMDLTPGVAVAGRLLIGIDADQDGTVSIEEGRTYAGRVLKDLHLALDDAGVTLVLRDVSFPSLPELNAGVGVIRIRAAAAINELQPGEHTLILKNHHLPTISVYQVNALVPKEEALRIVRQVRDELQTDYRLEFQVMKAPD